jgi:hypothetical protein
VQSPASLFVLRIPFLVKTGLQALELVARQKTHRPWIREKTKGRTVVSEKTRIII